MRISDWRGVTASIPPWSWQRFEYCNFDTCKLLLVTIGLFIFRAQSCSWDSSLSTRIKDAGIAIRHSRGRILFSTAGSRNGLEGVGSQDIHTQKQVVPEKMRLFCYRKIYWGRQTGSEDRPGSVGIDNDAHWSCKRTVTEDFCLKGVNIDPNIIKIRVSTFWMSGKSTDSRRRPTQPSRAVSFKPITAP